MSDPIAPPAARSPAAAAELVALAVSDGDLGAALAQYEHGAPLHPLADGGPAGTSPDGAGSAADDDGDNGDNGDGGTLHETLSAIMRLRLPVDIRLLAALPAAGLTMLVCERRIEGAGPDGRPVSLRGVGCTVVRPRQDGSWRIAADAWCLAGQDGQDGQNG